MNAMLNIQVRVLGQQAAAQIKAIQGQLNSLQNSVAKSNSVAGRFNSQLGRMSGLEKFGKNLQWTGRQLEFNFTLPLVLAGAAATKWALDNERSITRVRKVYGDLGEDVGGELEALERSFTLLSNRFGVVLSEVTDIGAAWAQAGAAGVALPKATLATLQTMILGEMEATEATKGLIAVQSAYRLNTQQLSEAIAELNVIENQTSIDLPGLIDVITRAGGSARTAGIDLRHLSSMASALVPAAGSASQAGNSLRTIFSRLLVPTSQAAEVLAEMGININDASWQAKNGVQRIETLAESFVNLSQGQQAMVSSLVASRWQINRFDTLMRDIALSLDEATRNQSSYGRALDATRDQQKANAIMAQELSTVLASSPRAFEILTTNIKNAMAEAIVPLLPTIISLLNSVRALVAGFNNLSPEVKSMVLSFALFLVVVGPAQRILGAVIQLVTTMGHVFHFAGRMVIGFAGIFGSVFGGLLNIAMTVVGGIASATSSAFVFLARGLGSAFVVMGDLTWKFLTFFIGAMRAGFTLAMTGVRVVLVNGLGATLAAMGQVVMAGLTAIGSAIAAIPSLVARAWILASQAAVTAWRVATVAITTFWTAMVEAVQFIGIAIQRAHVLASTGTIAIWRAVVGVFQAIHFSMVGVVWVTQRAILGAWSAGYAVLRGMQTAYLAFTRGMSALVGAAIASPWITLGIVAAAAITALLVYFREQIAKYAEEIGSGVVALVAGPFVALAVYFREDIVGAIIRAFNMLPQGIQNVLTTVVRMLSNFARAVAEWLSYLNPFARHSPSLVENVRNGMDEILRQYSRLNGVGTLLNEARAAHQAFLQTTTSSGETIARAKFADQKKEILEVAPNAGPAIDRMIDSILKLQDALKVVNWHLTQQQNIVDNLQSKLDDAMRPYNEALRENEFAQKRLRLEMLKMEKAGETVDSIREKFGKLNGEIEMLASERTQLKFAGAGSEILNVYDERIDKLRQQRNTMMGMSAPIEKIQDQLDELQLEGQILALERDVNLEPQIRQLEMEKEKLDDIKDVYDAINGQINDMEAALNSLSSSTGAKDAADNWAAAGLGDFEGPGGDSPPGLGREGGLADIEAFNAQMEQELQNALDGMGTLDLLGPFRDMWDQAWAWLEENVGPYVGPVWGAVQDFFDKHPITFENFLNGGLVGEAVGGIVDTLRNAGGPLREWAGTISSVFKSYGDILSDVWGVIKNKIGPVFSWLWEEIKKASDKIAPKLLQFGELLQPAQEAFGHLANVVEFVFKYVTVPIITTALAVILAAWNTTWPILRDILEPILNTISSLIGSTLDLIFNIIKFILALINGEWGDAWDAFKGMFKAVWDALVTIIQTPVNLILGIIEGMVNGAIGLINTLIDGINWVAEKLGLGFEIGKIGEVDLPMLGAPGAAVGGPKTTKISNLPGGRPGMTLARGGMWEGIPSFDFGRHGGFLTNVPTAIVGEGGAHPEFVIPTDPRFRDRALRLYEALGAKLLAGGGFFGGIKDAVGGAAGGAIKVVTGINPFEVGQQVANVADFFWSKIRTAQDMLKSLHGFFRDVAQGILNHTIEWGKDALGGLARGANLALDMAGLGGIVDVVGWINDIPGLANGGIVMPRPGGTLVRLGERGQAEAVQPLDRDFANGGGNTYNFYGDLSFPNIKSGKDAESFVNNLKSLAG